MKDLLPGSTAGLMLILTYAENFHALQVKDRIIFVGRY